MASEGTTTTESESNNSTTAGGSLLQQIHEENASNEASEESSAPTPATSGDEDEGPEKENQQGADEDEPVSAEDDVPAPAEDPAPPSETVEDHQEAETTPSAGSATAEVEANPVSETDSETGGTGTDAETAEIKEEASPETDSVDEPSPSSEEGSGTDEGQDQTSAEPESEEEEVAQEDTDSESSDIALEDIEGVALDAVIEAGILKNFLKAVLCIAEEARLDVTDDGFQLRAVDMANVGMIKMPRSATYFEEFEAADLNLGLPVNDLLETVQLFNADELLSISINKESHQLQIASENTTINRGLIAYDHIREQPDIPDFDMKVEAEVTPAEFTHALDAANLVSDHVEVHTSPDGTISVHADGDTDDVDMELEPTEIAVDADDVVNSIYAHEYISGLGPFDSDEPLMLRYSKDFPIEIRGTLDGTDYQFSYLVAPRIRED